jgi:N-acetylglucosaminyl-diphospho-decaprenol L-rhamnosyltransferase
VKLSVIIINYQVKYFLELCLRSVEKAVKGMEAEIIVVDNHSIDGSLVYLQPQFPEVRFLANTENKGFGRANNQALEQASGEYILFLNPDTVLPENFADQCLAFLATTPGIGGLGVRMIDGSGQFLKESRRGFPTAWVGFCRLCGLATLFPHSRIFSGYYMGYLPPDKAHPAPVLSGACLWVRRAILQEIGSFDEQFFMYGEDIDLSYRIEQAGYSNYYYPGVTMVHYKGESTRRDIRYVRQFYRAMHQFRRKHFGKGQPVFIEGGIRLAIQIRAGLAAAANFFRKSRNGQPRSGDEPQDSGLRTCILGDAMEAGWVRLRLEAAGKRLIVEKGQKADEWLLCEGESFSFQEGIEQLEKLGKQGRVLLHAAGSGVAVGSPNRKGQGEALILSNSLL